MRPIRLAIVALVLSVTPAHADPERPPRRRLLAIRIDLPGLTLAPAPADGWFQLIGVSASLRQHWLEGELAADFWASPCQQGPALTARLGASGGLLDGERWSLRAPVLLSYTYANLRGGGCDYSPDLRLQALTVAAGVDATRWGRSRGFTLRGLLFAGPQHESRLSYPEGTDWYLVYGFTLALGIALRL